MTTRERTFSGVIVMVRFLTVAALFSSLMASTAGQSADGIVITQRVTSGSDPLTVQLYIDATRMRTEIVSPSGVVNVTIFDGGVYRKYSYGPLLELFLGPEQLDWLKSVGPSRQQP